jgi:hypothetical protein
VGGRPYLIYSVHQDALSARTIDGGDITPLELTWKDPQPRTPGLAVSRSP